MTRLLFVSLLFLSTLAAQIATIKGRVTDPSDAVVPGALVTLRKAGSRELRQATNEEGVYEFKNVQPGAYTLRVQKPGFSLYAADGLPVSGPSSFDVRLTLAKDSQTLKVEDEQNAVTTDAQQNAGALVLREAELKSLSDDPDQLAQELQALAGPGAGPNGGQIFIDGFTGGRIPEILHPRNPHQPEPLLRRVRPHRLRPHRDPHQARHRQIPRRCLLQLLRRKPQLPQSLLQQQTALPVPPLRRPHQRANQQKILLRPRCRIPQRRRKRCHQRHPARRRPRAPADPAGRRHSPEPLQHRRPRRLRPER